MFFDPEGILDRSKFQHSLDTIHAFLAQNDNPEDVGEARTYLLCKD